MKRMYFAKEKSGPGRLPPAYNGASVSLRTGSRLTHFTPEDTTLRVVPGSRLADRQIDLKELGEEIIQAIYDSDITPSQRASTIYTRSRQLLRDLFKHPTTELVGQTKRIVGSIVDSVLDDDETASSLLRISMHDRDTYTHSVNVGFYALCLAKRIYRRSHGHNMHELGAAFFLHDIGKTVIDPAILCKPGPLTEREMSVVRTHPECGIKLLEQIGQASFECQVVTMQHHEREDGSGYPFGLQGDDIHEYARIASMADVFDALTSRRPYRRPVSAYNALVVMRDELIDHFQREMFRNFIMLFSDRAAA